MSQQGIYSESKLVWWYAREGELPSAPKQVQLILSDLCNQDCHFCAYRMSGYSSNQLFVGGSELAAKGHNNPKRWIEPIRALELVEEIAEAGALSVQFTGGGEPTVHPKHEEIFERALDLGLNCSLVSNGVRWSERLIHEILPRFSWVRVSIDAPSSQRYQEIRRVPESHWERVWQNVRAFGKVHGDCRFGLGYVVTPESWTGILRFAELAAESGADNMRYTAMFSNEDEGPFSLIYDGICSEIGAAKARFERPDFRIYDNFGSRFADLQQHAPDYRRCGYQHYTTYIGGDLRAYRCCVLAYNKRGLIKGGDLTTKSFKEFWESNERKEDFERFDSRACERCQFNSKNRALNYVIDPQEHVEWP